MRLRLSSFGVCSVVAMATVAIALQSAPAAQACDTSVYPTNDHCYVISQLGDGVSRDVSLSAGQIVVNCISVPNGNVDILTSEQWVGTTNGWMEGGMIAGETINGASFPIGFISYQRTSADNAAYDEHLGSPWPLGTTEGVLLEHYSGTTTWIGGTYGTGWVTVTGWPNADDGVDIQAGIETTSPSNTVNTGQNTLEYQDSSGTLWPDWGEGPVGPLYAPAVYGPGSGSAGLTGGWFVAGSSQYATQNNCLAGAAPAPPSGSPATTASLTAVGTHIATVFGDPAPTQMSVVKSIDRARALSVVAPSSTVQGAAGNAVDVIQERGNFAVPTPPKGKAAPTGQLLTILVSRASGFPTDISLTEHGAAPNLSSLGTPTSP
jgi:hypothetical protein